MILLRDTANGAVPVPCGIEATRRFGIRIAIMEEAVGMKGVASWFVNYTTGFIASDPERGLRINNRPLFSGGDEM